MLAKSIAILFFLISLKDVKSFRREPNVEGPYGEGTRGEVPFRIGGPQIEGPLREWPQREGSLGGRPLEGISNQNTRLHGGSLRDTICSLPENNFAGLFSEPGHPPDAPFVCELCTDNITFPLCAINASRCFPRPGSEIRDKIPTAFCECINSVPGVYDIHARWVTSSNGGIDTCSNQTPGGPIRMPFGQHREHGNFMPPNPRIALNHIGFMQTLNQSDPTLLSSFECCLSQKTGLFDRTGTVNATAWHLKAMDNPDGVAANAIDVAIDQCAASVPICSVHSFMSCIMTQCFWTIQTSSG